MIYSRWNCLWIQTCSKRNATLLLLFGHTVESDRDILQFGREGRQGRDTTHPTHLNWPQGQLLNQSRPILNKAVTQYTHLQTIPTQYKY